MAKDYVCYQTILSKPTKRTPARNEDRCDCKGTVRLYPDGTYKVINAHSTRANHESIMQDMETANRIKELSIAGKPISRGLAQNPCKKYIPA